MNMAKKSLFDFEASEKESGSYDDYDKMKSYQLDPGVEFIGTPTINLFENKDKKYDSIRLRLADDEEKQLLDCYINIPKRDENGYIRRINKSFSFYHTAFNFIKNTIEIMDENDLSHIKQFKKLNIQQIINVYENAHEVRVIITKGHPDDDYNSFIVTQIG